MPFSLRYLVLINVIFCEAYHKELTDLAVSLPLDLKIKFSHFFFIQGYKECEVRISQNKCWIITQTNIVSTIYYEMHVYECMLQDIVKIVGNTLSHSYYRCLVDVSFSYFLYDCRNIFIFFLVLTEIHYFDAILDKRFDQMTASINKTMYLACQNNCCHISIFVKISFSCHCYVLLNMLLKCHRSNSICEQKVDQFMLTIFKQLLQDNILILDKNTFSINAT